MKRVTFIAAILAIALVGACASNPEAAQNMEAAEDMEESAGDEAELIGDNPDDMEGWNTPGGEVEAEMEAEPYPD